MNIGTCNRGWMVLRVEGVGEAYSEHTGFTLDDRWGQWSSSRRRGVIVIRSKRVEGILLNENPWEMADVLDVGDEVVLKYLEAWALSKDPWRKVGKDLYLARMPMVTVALRGDTVIPVNGHHIVRPQHMIMGDGFSWTPDLVVAEVVYKAIKNVKYFEEEDISEVEVGDLVVYRRFAMIRLEDEARVTLGDDLFRVEERLVIGQIINEGEMSEFKALGARLYVVMLEKDQAEGVMELTDDQRLESNIGRILHFGKDCKKHMEEEGMDMRVGDEVFIRGAGGATVTIDEDGRECKIIDWREIAMHREGSERGERIIDTDKI